jgi:NitT/TauT family transport system substrate-binding protein
MALAVASPLTGAADSASAGTELTKVAFRLDGPYYGGHVPLIAGIKKGIYRKHGLDVTAAPGQGSLIVVQLIANGKVDFGFPDFGVLVRARAENLPIRGIMGVQQKTPYLIVSKKERNIRTPKDLEDAKMGFVAAESSTRVFPLVARKAKIDLAKITSNATNVGDYGVRNALFFQGKVDTAFAYTTSLPSYKQQCNCELSTISMSDFGIRIMANGIATSEAMLQQHPDTVRRFLAATRESIEFAVKNPEEAVDLFFEYVGPIALKRETVLAGWKAGIDLLRTDATASMPIGCMAGSDWQGMTDQLLESGQIKQAPQVKTMYTNQFLVGCPES